MHVVFLGNYTTVYGIQRYDESTNLSGRYMPGRWKSVVNQTEVPCVISSCPQHPVQVTDAGHNTVSSIHGCVVSIHPVTP